MRVRVRVGHVRMIALFANKWHIAMYEDAKVVCSVLEMGPGHCRYVRWVLRTGGGSRDAVRIAP
eukprot:scaffold70168_cov62-Phaeocystis_antarctica.AAC.2